MEYALDLDVMPRYGFSSYRYFDEKEKHVTRYCEDDVLIMMLDGILRFREDGRDVELSGGEYYIQRRGLYQEGIRESDMPRYYYVHFTGEYGESEHSLPLRGTVDASALTPLFDELDRLCITGASGVELNAVFYGILSKLRGRSPVTGHSALVHQVVTMVTKDLSKRLSLSEIARACGYCENHLINVFRRETGMTPHAYFMSLRLDRACRLLEDSEMPVFQIAEECGFGDGVNLYKHFVREKGVPPSRWRRTRRGG